MPIKYPCLKIFQEWDLKNFTDKQKQSHKKWGPCDSSQMSQRFWDFSRYHSLALGMYIINKNELYEDHAIPENSTPSPTGQNKDG